MNIDKRVLYFANIFSIAVLLLVFFMPGEHSGRIVASILLLLLAAVTWFYIRKRNIPSMHNKEILLIMSIIGVVYLVLLYLSVAAFGFYKNINFLKFAYIIPIAIIIISSEVMRWVVRSQNDNIADYLCYACCVVAEALSFGTIHYITTFNRFMDFVGIVLFPAIVANLVYHYLSKRYGMYPNIVYRAITTLAVYFIPIKPDAPQAMMAFASLFIPILIYIFIDTLYEKKHRYALEKKSKIAPVFTGVAVVVMTALVMLISNQFKYGTLVIVTESMTGEINKGDAIIYEEYTDQPIEEGLVIVFEKNGSVVVHRVIDIDNIDGVTRYFTKGDANEDPDAGYITSAQIVGVVDLKLPYIGYPTILLRSLFSN